MYIEKAVGKFSEAMAVSFPLVRSSIVIIIIPEIQLASVAVFLENVTTLQTGISRQFCLLRSTSNVRIATEGVITD